MSSINDKSDWKLVRKALSVIEFSESDLEVRLNSTLSESLTQTLSNFLISLNRLFK